jgi:hypothetical protein
MMCAQCVANLNVLSQAHDDDTQQKEPRKEQPRTQRARKLIKSNSANPLVLKTQLNTKRVLFLANLHICLF